MRLFHMALAATVATCVAVPLQAQMLTMQMGGGSYTTHLVSPITADTQIGRGMLMISSGMSGMGGMPVMTPGPGGNARGLRIRLMLGGVVGHGVRVTSSGNHLYVSASLTSADGSSQPISVDQLFDINAGTAVLYVPLTLSSFTLPAVLQIANVEIADANGTTFGMPGLRMSAVPTQQMTPGMGGSTKTPGMGPRPMMALGMGGRTMTPGMGGPRATMTPRMGGSTMTPGTGSHATMTPGMGGFTMTPGMGPRATMTPGMGGFTMTPGMGSHATMTPGMGGFTMTPGVGSRATMTPGMGSHMGMGRQ